MAVYAKDIAAKLGLSPAAVSLALRGKPGIGQETRERILRTAAEMGYRKRADTGRPSLCLVLYKRHGAVVSDTDFFAALTESITRQARLLGYELLITYFYGNQDSAEQLRSLKASPCDGILLLATEMVAADFAPFRSLTVPLVVLDSYFPDEKYDSVLINNVYGAKRAVQYLIAQGHSEIGYLSSKVMIRNFHERQDGWLRGIQTIPVANDSRHHVVKVSPTADGAFRDMTAYLQLGGKLPTAFFADNDLIAISCARALRAAGYRIPEDVSLIGVDGIAAGELLDVEERLYQEQLHDALEEALRKLTEREQAVIRGNFYAGKSVRQISEEQGLTIGQANTAKANAFRKLRRNPRLLRWHDQVLTSHAWHGTSFTAWAHGGSVEERAVEYLESRLERMDSPAGEVMPNQE